MNKSILIIIIKLILLNKQEEKLRAFINSEVPKLSANFSQTYSESQKSILKDYLKLDISNNDISLEKDSILRLKFYHLKVTNLPTTLQILEGWMPNLNANEVFEFVFNFESPMHINNIPKRLSTHPTCLNKEESIQTLEMNAPIISKRQMLVNKITNYDELIGEVSTINDSRQPVSKNVVRALMSKMTRFTQVGTDVQFRDISIIDMKGWVPSKVLDITMAEQLTKEYEINYQIIKAHFINNDVVIDVGKQ